MAFGEKNITKFHVGRFTNGVYTVFGFMLNGHLRGIVISKKLKSIKLFSFISIPEYFDINDKYPFFKKKINFIRKYNTKFRIDEMISFLEEVANLPKCALNYSDFINQGKRQIIFEKSNNKMLFDNYFSLNGGWEFWIINTVSEKYSNKCVRYVCFEKPADTADIMTLYHDDICPVLIPTAHNKEIYAVIANSYYIHGLYDRFVRLVQRDLGVDKEFEKFKEKNLLK